MSTAFGMTAKQDETLDFIKKFMAEHDGLSPTFDEIKDGIGLRSKSGIKRLVSGLKERGRIDYLPARARTIVVLAP